MLQYLQKLFSVLKGKIKTFENDDLTKGISKNYGEDIEISSLKMN